MMNKTKAKTVAENVNVFKKAVEATPDITNCYQPGLSALGKYSKKIKASQTSKIDGSVDIDTCTSKKYPQANRWDYAVGYNSEAYFIEVHSAITSEVHTMVKKLEWLKHWLNTHAVELNKLKAQKKTFVWIQSDKFDIPKHTPQFRLAVSKGIVPVRELLL